MAEDSVATTRLAVHSLGEHVLAAARYQAVGRIGLSVVPGGFATPAFGDTDRIVSFVNGELVVTDHAGERRTEASTLRAAGEFVGVTPGAPAQVYTPITPCNLDEPLQLDRTQLKGITDWYELVDAALADFRSEISADDPSPATLWPEHFDVAIRAADINYGGLAGDAAIASPYIYIGPDLTTVTDPTDAFWNQSFGASRTVDEIGSVSDALSFFHAGRERAGR